MEKEDITFRIDVFSPETLPMGRLAEYLAHLSTLYGQKEKVHFKGIEKGSKKSRRSHRALGEGWQGKSHKFGEYGVVKFLVQFSDIQLV